MNVVATAKTRFTAARQRWPLLDHAVLTLQHYGDVRGGAMAGNITYYGFLSFFPVLAISFAVVGIVSNVYPQADASMNTALRSVLPGIIGSGSGQINTDNFANAAATAGILGVAGLLYSGLGWLSAMRQGLQDAFEKPRDEEPNFVVGKLRDVAALGVLGVILLVSVGLSTTVTNFGETVRSAFGLASVPGTGGVIWLLGLLLGVVASTVLFLAMFRMLAAPDVSRRALLDGALFSAVGFELLKLLATYLIGAATRSPAAAVFGTALVLVVWINYFARVTLYGASWAATEDKHLGRVPRAAAAGADRGGLPVELPMAVRVTEEAALVRQRAIGELLRSTAAVAALAALRRVLGSRGR